MEIITKEIIENYILHHHIALKSTHHQLSIPIINRIYRKMVNNIKFDTIKVCDGLIIDGHHRYISALLANYKIGSIPSSISSGTIEYDWKTVAFKDEEWDTEHKIHHLNKMDAEYNGMTLENIIEITR